VLLFMLAWRGRSKAWLAAIAVYGTAMWISTVALNLHYVVDLLLGAAVAAAAWWLTERLARWGILERFGGAPCENRTASPPAA
jgi:membrane-associated phospholipid phosphatase